MAVARKLKQILEENFPPPDKVELRDKDRIIGILTSKRFRRMDTMQRQELIYDILAANLTKEEQRDVLMIVCLTPEEELAYAADKDE
jgi:acid stress-induced BolA-like protein IbaG/YrbA